MGDHIRSDSIIERKIHIGEIPAILFRPKNRKGLFPTIIFYHGWSSSKESQRMRGFILSAAGYQVIIPDAINHGERNPLKQYNKENAGKYFWDTIFNNIDESKSIIEAIISNFEADPNSLGVMGNSMGGFTAAGVFTHNPETNALVVFNGSCDWMDSNNDFIKDIKAEPDEKTINTIKALDPANNLELLIDRPILMLHGDADDQVPIKCQKEFYRKIEPVYEDKDRIKLIEYPNLNHFVTTNMMEEGLAWLDRYM